MSPGRFCSLFPLARTTKPRDLGGVELVGEALEHRLPGIRDVEETRQGLLLERAQHS